MDDVFDWTVRQRVSKERERERLREENNTKTFKHLKVMRTTMRCVLISFDER